MNITMQGLTKQYGDFYAVDHMDLQIEDGKLVGLLGPSGCGKSTTLFMLAGLTEPTKGKIIFGEDDVTNIATEKREIGLVFQNYALYPNMTVAEKIMFPLVNRKVPKKEALEMAYEMAKLVHLEELMKRKPKALSGGQQQRVAIARALVKKPKVLLLDEPLSNLDAKLRIETREEIRRIQQEVKITTVFVTHDQEEAMSICDKIAILDKGILQQYEEPQKMYIQPANEFAARFLGMPQINIIKASLIDNNLCCDDVILRANCSQAIKENCQVDQDVQDINNLRIGVRPEAFIFGEEGFEVTAEHVRMTGRDLLIFFKLGEQELKLLVHSDTSIQKGDRFKLRVRDKQIYLFDGENGCTLGRL